MDTSSVLEKYTLNLSNLPLEVHHLMQEIKNKDIQLTEARKRYQTRDNQLHKFIRANGTLTKHPKESQLYAKIEDDMKKVQQLQKEKIILANTAAFLVSKHLFNFELDIAKLEQDDALPPLPADFLAGDDFEGISGSLKNGPTSDFTESFREGLVSASATPGPRSQSRMGSSVSLDGVSRGQKRKHTLLVRGTSGVGRLKRLKSEEAEERHGMKPEGSGPGNNDDADNNLYCFCQRVSFGEMIGCDNGDCKYEWFHWGCVGITSPPKDDEVWYCPDCAPKMEKRKKKRK